MELEDAVDFALRNYFSRSRTPETQPDAIGFRLDLCKRSQVGWILFYQSKKYLETGDLQQALVGNQPLIVDERDMTVRSLPREGGTEYSLDAYLKLHPSPPEGSSD